jgi:hypothetical protein
MNDPNQLTVPESFTALYLAPGGYKTTLPRAELIERYEFCDDLANMLTEHAANIKFDTGIHELDVLERCHQGLLNEGAGVSPDEAGWVIGRLAELMNWPQLNLEQTEKGDSMADSFNEDDSQSGDNGDHGNACDEE